MICRLPDLPVMASSVMLDRRPVDDWTPEMRVGLAAVMMEGLLRWLAVTPIGEVLDGRPI
jgi:hypothetical protein